MDLMQLRQTLEQIVKLVDATSMRARLSTEEAAKLLGFPAHDIPVLVQAKLLKPLGSPAPNAPKYFAKCEVQALANDPAWLDKATRAVSKFWKEKNRRRKDSTLGEAQEDA
jgi:hypothetical protein